MIQLDGSHGEGGGSILRQALAFSILTGKEFTIKDIRKGRPNPGLAPQHLAAINAAAEACGATLWGNALGSTEVYFKPGEFKGGNHKIDIGTAGSATLLMQSVLLPAVFSKKRSVFTITGGTDVSWSQPFDYFKSVFLPQLRRYADIDATLLRRGYYPKGGGEMKVSISSKCSKDDFLKQIILASHGKARLLQVRGVSHASLDLEPHHVSERQADSARLRLSSLNVPVSITTAYSNSLSIGSGITLWALFGREEMDFDNPIILGADALGERGKKAEAVGLESAESLLNSISTGCCADAYLCDQLVPYLGIAGGVIRTSRVSGHALSNIYVAEQFLGVKLEVSENANTISCSLL